jgi:hypothetical protein
MAFLKAPQIVKHDDEKNNLRKKFFQPPRQLAENVALNRCHLRRTPCPDDGGYRLMARTAQGDQVVYPLVAEPLIGAMMNFKLLRLPTRAAAVAVMVQAQPPLFAPFR